MFSVYYTVRCVYSVYSVCSVLVLDSMSRSMRSQRKRFHNISNVVIHCEQNKQNIDSTRVSHWRSSRTSSEGSSRAVLAVVGVKPSQGSKASQGSGRLSLQVCVSEGLDSQLDPISHQNKPHIDSQLVRLRSLLTTLSVGVALTVDHHC